MLLWKITLHLFGFPRSWNCQWESYIFNLTARTLHFIQTNFSFLVYKSNTLPSASCADCNVGVFPGEKLLAANFSSKLDQKLNIYIYRNWIELKTFSTGEMLIAAKFSSTLVKSNRIVERHLLLLVVVAIPQDSREKCCLLQKLF